MAKKEAVEATVTGNDHQVDFRAAVMKQAIKYNLDATSAGVDQSRPGLTKVAPGAHETVSNLGREQSR
jgi:hypothetical protein